MTDRVQIQITATDGASRVFGQVASSADRMDQSLDRASTTSEKFSAVGAAIGASLGIAVVAFGQFGRAAAESEAAQARVETAVESTGAAFEEYAAQIQAVSDTALSLSFDDEDALNAIAAITTATGDAAFAIENLGLVMDIARGRSIDLAAASKIVIAAEQGRYGSLARLGIVLDETATKQEALAALQTKYAGQAEAYAETSGGAFDRFREKVENVEEAIGAHAEAATSLALVAQTIGPAFTLATTAVGAIAPALTKAAAASAAFSLATGPVGIAAAAGLAAVGIYKLWEASEGLVSSVDIADQHLGDLEQTMRELYAAGNTLGELAEIGVEGIFPDLSADAERIREIEDAIAQTNRVIGETGEATAEQEANLERWGMELLSLTDKYGVLDHTMLSSTLSQQAVIDGMDDLNAILSNTGAGAAQAQEETKELFDQFERGEISGAMLLEDLDLIASSLGTYDENATKAASGTASLTQAQNDYNMALAVANQTLEQYLQNQQIGGQNLAGEHRETAAAIEAETRARDEANRAMQEYLDQEQQIAGASFAADTATKTLTESTTDYITAIYNANVAANGYNQALANQAALETNLANAREAYADTFAQMQADATRASDVLGTVFGAIVGNTDAIASQSQAVEDWSTGLLEAELSAENYGTALESNTRILAANASVQADVLSIQAQLSPIVATATEALAAQMDEIESGSTDAQLFALGMMDAATSSQALALAQGYLENQDVFGPMIQQAAELNPMLAQILEEMGLISYNPATGEVRLLGADEAISDLDRVTEALERLIQVQWIAMFDGDITAAEQAYEDATGLLVDWDNNEGTADLLGDNSDALARTEEAQNAVDTFGRSSGTASISVSDSASGVIQGAINLLGSFDGRTATSYIQTIDLGVSGTRIGLGGVASYATGGMVRAEMAEWGPELLHFPNGGVALARDRGIYSVPQGTYVDTAPATAQKLGGMGSPAISIHIHGPASWDDAAEQVSRKLVPAIQRAMREHDRSLGAY